MRAKGLVELGAFATRADDKFSSVYNREIVSLAKMVAMYLGRRLLKGKVRTSNWEADLSRSMVECKADCYRVTMSESLTPSFPLVFSVCSVSRRSKRLSLRTHGVRQTAGGRRPRRQDPRHIDIRTPRQSPLAQTRPRRPSDASARCPRADGVVLTRLLYTRTATTTTASRVQALARRQDAA